jgi:superoxide dismutase, Fe-Mn family
MTMEALIRELPFDPSNLKGLSERLLRSHHQNNYSGAVKRLNAIRGDLRSCDFEATPGFMLNGLKREELVAMNSMLLHELYFASLTPSPQPMSGAMNLALGASFGSAERWRSEFVAMAKALSGGSGWVLLSFEPREGRLVNQWAADHTHAVAGGVPILALDMYEHAYHLDFGAAASAYVQAFMDSVDWLQVYERYQQCVSAASGALGVTTEYAGGARLIDVRRKAVFDESDALAEGAVWRDPAQVDRWAGELTAGETVVVYCVYGHEVGQATALRLRAAGIDASFLIGGFDGWRSTGQPVAMKPGR